MMRTLKKLIQGVKLMKNLFAAYYYYFYFFGFMVDKVRVFFAAIKPASSLAWINTSPAGFFVPAEAGAERETEK